jgi:hypothetical protein
MKRKWDWDIEMKKSVNGIEEYIRRGTGIEK